MSAAALSLAGVLKCFGGLTVLTGVDLEVRPGEILGVIGKNGAGKTTLFNLISGLLKPDGGKVALDGEDVGELSPHLRARRGIARTFQVPQPLPKLSMPTCLKAAVSRFREAVVSSWAIQLSAVLILVSE